MIIVISIKENKNAFFIFKLKILLIENFDPINGKNNINPEKWVRPIMNVFGIEVIVFIFFLLSAKNKINKLYAIPNLKVANKHTGNEDVIMNKLKEFDIFTLKKIIDSDIPKKISNISEKFIFSRVDVRQGKNVYILYIIPNSEGDK